MGDTDSSQLLRLLTELTRPFYHRPEFWISFILGLVGIGFSFLAFLEARRAKAAANAAAYNLKIQNITLELAEIVSGMDALDSKNVTYPSARDSINELTRKLTRLLSPFQNDEAFAGPVTEVRKALSEIKESFKNCVLILDKSLQMVRPSIT